MSSYPQQRSVVLSTDIDETNRTLVHNPYSRDTKIRVVIIHFRRPANILSILDSFKAQTVPCHVTIIYVPFGQRSLPGVVNEKADEVIAVRENFGSFNRYVTSSAFFHPYTYFHDDDMLPGPRLLEGFLAHSGLSYGVLGQIGRRRTLESFEPVLDVEEPTPVDFVCRGYWVQTRDLPCIQRLLWAAWERGYDPGVREDDILLGRSIEAYTGRGAYVVPALPHGKMEQQKLPEPHAMWKEEGHRARRLEFMRTMDSVTAGLRNRKGRIIVAGIPPAENRELVEHVRGMAIRSWLKRRFPGRSCIELQAGQEVLGPRLRIADRDLLVLSGGGEPIDALLAANPHVPALDFRPTRPDGEEGRSDLLGLEVVASALLMDGRLELPVLERDGVLAAFREPGKAECDEAVTEIGLPVHECDLLANEDVTEGLREWQLVEMLTRFASVRVVVTDRADALVFALLSRTPCVALATGESGIAALREAFDGITALRFVDGTEQFAAQTDEAMAGDWRDAPDFRKTVEVALEHRFAE